MPHKQTTKNEPGRNPCTLSISRFLIHPCIPTIRSRHHSGSARQMKQSGTLRPCIIALMPFHSARTSGRKGRNEPCNRNSRGGDNAHAAIASNLRSVAVPTACVTAILWWRECDGIPPQWEAVKNDPNVVYGRLFRSGRKCEEFRS